MDTERILLVGYRAADLFEPDRGRERATAAWTAGDVTCHCLDIYHRHAIEKVHHLKTICSPHLPEGPWDFIRYRTGPKIMSGELSLDLLQEIHALAPKRFELDFVGRESEKNDLLDKIRKDPKRVRDFSARWTASVPGGAPLEFTSYPGCFCHRRQDAGGLALAEVVARELLSGEKRPLRILDMGCGCGLVGFLVAARLREAGWPAPELVSVDSHTRAIEATELNAKNFNLPVEAILSDDGTPPRMDGSFDIFVGNPPYYSDYRIADVFLETAARALQPGGTAYSVCKNAAGLEPVQRRFFPTVEILHRRGYAILRSTHPNAGTVV